MGAERDRVEAFGSLENWLQQADDWYLWGPYLSERQWGTVRADYSPDGEAWSYLPHDRARSQAYRWGEDGLRFSDVEQRGPAYSKDGIDDHVQKFLEHFASIRGAIESQSLWDDTDGLFSRPTRPDTRATAVLGALDPHHPSTSSTARRWGRAQ
jgi:hypothetical protein